MAETAQGENVIVILPHLSLSLFPPQILLHPNWSLRVKFCLALFYAHIPYTRPLILLTDKSVISPESRLLRGHFFPALEQCTVIESLSKHWLARWGKGNPVPLFQWPGWPLVHCVWSKQTAYINLYSVGGSATSWSRGCSVRTGWPL